MGSHIIHILAKSHLCEVELDIYSDNVMEQIVEEYAVNLQLQINPRHFPRCFNKRTGNHTNNPYSTVDELDLREGDILWIDDASCDATVTSFFEIVSNTYHRMHSNSSDTQDDCQKEEGALHELYVASSNSEFRHRFKYYTDDSLLRDIITPRWWCDEWYGTENETTQGCYVKMIVNEQTGKCAFPSEFDMPISDFIGDRHKLGCLFVILEDDTVPTKHLEVAHEEVL